MCGVTLVACGGGSVNTTPTVGPTSAASAGATAAPTATALAGATSIAVPTTASTVTLPAVNGQSATLGIAAGAPAGVTLMATATTTAPANAPAPSFVRRTASIANAVPFYYVYLTASATLSLQYITSESVPVANPSSTAAYYAEYDDVTTTPAVKLFSEGPATQSSTYETIQNSYIGEATIPSLVAGHTYLLQFYYEPATATPTPAPNATPTSAPTASPSPAATPTIPATPASTASAIPITLPAQDYVTVAFPAASLPSNIVGGSIEFFETANAAANLSVTLANAPPAGYPALPPAASGNGSAYASILTLTYISNVAIPAFGEPIVTFTDASTTQQPTTPGYSTYCGVYSVAGGPWQPASGAFEQSGNFVTSPTSLQITLQASQSFVYAIYYDSASSAGTPTCN
jgi:hypothetical protein